ncbi:GPI transamidase component PIG-S [Nymphaea thermarum]|nr:GPI transamidase component PIG-S [Nymphaea thermarum]
MADSSERQDEALEESTTRNSPPGTKRLKLTLCVLFSFVLGFPFLLKSTEIYRSPLPFQSIDSFSNRLEKDPLLLPCRLRAAFLGFDRIEVGAHELGISISREIERLTGGGIGRSGCASDGSVEVTIDSGNGCVGKAVDGVGRTWPCGLQDSVFSRFALDSWEDDERVDEALEALYQGDGGCSDCVGDGVYTVFVINGDWSRMRTVVGKHRHAWVLGKLTEANAASLIGRVFVKFFINGGRDVAFSGGEGESMPVAADGSVVLSFSLLNSNPNDWVYDWDFQKIDDIFLSPVVNALAPVANISVESQVLYYAPKASHSFWDSKLSSYVSRTKDLPFFVNSNEWHLDTSVAAAGRSKILHFVVYIPSAQECPLVLQLPGGDISITNGFVSPMWGGVVIWNPPSCLKNSQRPQPSMLSLSSKDLEQVFSVFLGQLRLLFGLSSDNLQTEDFNILASETGFTAWELDFLIRRHASFNLFSCATTLGSLSKLVQSLPSMIIMDEIGSQVKLSLEASTSAKKLASQGIYDAVAFSSRQARALAENAFFHPSIMSLLYFPIEHHIAIYMPFFVPVLMHVFLATFKEAKRYRQEKAKFLARKTKVKVS